jgi:hypothetical protein
LAVRSASRGSVGRELARFGEELAHEGVAQVGGAFTDVPAADALVKSSPEAFLLAVLFTQGIPAERAWAGPYLLRERLGHLDLARLVSERGAVDAAARLLDRYGGSASRIWSDDPTAIELMERLSAFQGIGRKKAAMTVELLNRCFGVHVRDLEGGTVAYDTQVRRVFLRAGLVDRDTPEDVARAASEVLPRSPGTLDLPAWLIGRQWCRPARPVCDACRLADVCPRLVERQVQGVGARGPSRRERSGDRP